MASNPCASSLTSAAHIDTVVPIFRPMHTFMELVWLLRLLPQKECRPHCPNMESGELTFKGMEGVVEHSLVEVVLEPPTASP
ncbi:hypothetical protein AMTR_s00039p00079790 [Amborella trichopoda]|uniref:Uncharacterized protein n=1 Tax=Amborella trichopoda TaxID=13333 RepID=U5D0I3_AMBTC|nr:hypothetical protein AMTR_s00039p00079790 [Amborella trichopoda]